MTFLFLDMRLLKEAVFDAFGVRDIVLDVSNNEIYFDHDRTIFSTAFEAWGEKVSEMMAQVCLVQVIPHITNEIKTRMQYISMGAHDVTQWENPWEQIGRDENDVPLYITKAFEIANKYAPNISLVFNQRTSLIS